jgi:hypothetical protein
MAMLKTKDGGINWKAEHRKELAWATRYEEKRIRAMRFWFDIRHREDHADTTLDYEQCRKEFYRNRKQLRWIRSYIARTARKLVAQYKSTSN